MISIQTNTIKIESGEVKKETNESEKREPFKLFRQTIKHIVCNFKTKSFP